MSNNSNAWQTETVGGAVGWGGGAHLIASSRMPNQANEKDDAAEQGKRGLIAKFQMGSVHGRMTYSTEEKAFHHSDVPPMKRKQKEQVKKASKPDILGVGPKKWNQSVKTREKLCERKSRQLSKVSASHLAGRTG